MRINSSVSDINLSKTGQTNFKAVYPVVYWVAEGSSKEYFPIVTKEKSKFFSTKLVTILNKQKSKLEAEINELLREKERLGRFTSKKKIKYNNLNLYQKIKRFISGVDKDYAEEQFARSFSIHNKSPLKINPQSYIITGKDAGIFEQNYGKPIGYIRSQLGGQRDSAELQEALNDYWTKGQNYVKTKAKRFSQDNQPLVLHVKLNTERAKTGTVKDYRIVDMKFFTESDTDNRNVMNNWRKILK